MAWLTGLTGKAEELLNRLDQNAAVALQKEKQTPKFNNDQLLEVTSAQVPESKKRYTPPLPSKPSPIKAPIPTVKSSPNLVPTKVQDDQLIEFLNDFTSVDIEDSRKENGPKEKETSKKLENGDNVNIEVNGTSSEMEITALEKENQMLKNEVRSLNNEMSLLLHRTKAAEKETERIKGELIDTEGRVSRLQADLQGSRLQSISDNERLRSLQTENEKLAQMSTESNGKQNVAMDELQQRLLDAEAKQNAVASELSVLQDRLRNEEEERNRIEGVRQVLQSENEGMTQRLAEMKAEFEQYRTRAQRTLTNKDQLIAELRKSPSDSSTDSLLEIELKQLREERTTLCEESQQMAGRLETLRGQLANVEKRLEVTKEESAAAQRALQESLSQEQRRRELIEEDCRMQTEELHSIREELSRQRAQLTSRLRERETELSRLRSQLTQRPASPPPPPPELEARLTALTSTLVQKQGNLEILSSEKNALRLQLEKTEHKYREAISLLNQVQGRMINVNDTDDAKAQVPSFLIESPFDTGVTRRVKRAYSSLDAVGIRTSVFLRRYPLARIIVLFYVIVLHLWVFLVLFSYTPDTNGKP